MESLCHRCSNPLSEGESFCSHCGAPQLVVDTSEPVGPQTTPQRLGGDLARVQWRAGITSALLLAIPVGLLSALSGALSSLVGTFLVIAGGFGTIFLYRHRTNGITDGRIGWRLGAILGIAAAAIATATDAAELLVERYLLHHAAVIDAQFQSAAQQLADQALKTNPEAVRQAPQFVHAWAGFWLSGDGHAAIQLMTAAIVSMGIILFAATGGAIAGRMLAPRPGTQRTM